jgi:tetratricopeptide (TPR) repeat protein
MWITTGSAVALVLAVGLALPALAQDAAESSPEAKLQVARAAQLAGDWQTAEQLLAAAIADPQSFGEGTVRGECLRELTLCRIHLADYDGAMDSAIAADDFYTSRDDYLTAGQTMSTLGGLLRAAGRPDLASEAYSKALTSYTRLADHEAMASTRLSLGIVSDMQGELEQAVRHFDGALALFRQLGDEESVALCYRNQGYAHLRLGHFEQAAAACQQALFIYNQLGLEALAAATHCELGAAYYEMGDFEAALAECELGLGYWATPPGDLSAAECLRFKGLALAALERPQEALNVLDQCWELLEQAGRWEEMAELLPAVSGVLGELGRSEETGRYRDSLQRAMEASTAVAAPGGY